MVSLEARGNKNTYIKIESYTNAKQICLGGTAIWFIKSNNALYRCGYSKPKHITPENAVKICDNVKQISEKDDSVRYITEDNKLYNWYSGKTVEITEIKIDNDAILCDASTIMTGNVYYTIAVQNGGWGKLKESNVLPYYNNYNGYKFLQTRETYIYQNKEGKIYIRYKPNITKIGEKSNYNLRKVFENIIFVQGNGNDGINIVDKEGKVYESAYGRANEKIEKAKKIISSNRAKYVITSDGKLWAKGNQYTGMWSDEGYKSDYVQITKDGTNAFKNVADIYIAKNGSSAIFRTEDNKIYWAGATSYIILPGIKGDYDVNGIGTVTNYPKEVTSNILEQIREKIKDIKYSFISKGGVNGCTTLILTEDGKIYTMSNNVNMSGNSIATNNSGDFTELTIKEGTTVKQVITEDGLSLALLSNGEVYGWGYNTYGILGPSYEVGGIYPTPVKLEGLPANIRYMSLGNGFAIFASKSGEVYGIGKNDYGQLGTGDSIGRTEFVRCTKLEE